MDLGSLNACEFSYETRAQQLWHGLLVGRDCGGISGVPPPGDAPVWHGLLVGRDYGGVSGEPAQASAAEGEGLDWGEIRLLRNGPNPWKFGYARDRDTRLELERREEALAGVLKTLAEDRAFGTRSGRAADVGVDGLWELELLDWELEALVAGTTNE